MDGQNLLKSLNSRNKNLQVDVQVITLEDNLDHPYFSLIDMSKNNLSPIGVAVMEAPYTPYISHYWIKYHGEIVISFNMDDLSIVNTNSSDFFNYVNNTEKSKFYKRLKQQKEREKKNKEKNNKEDKDEKKYENMKQRFQNDEYNYSMICKVSRFKQKGNKFVIYFEDLGWKFLQKVPKEFRDTFIAGQSLDNAFQAICEFLGVQYAYSIEDLSKFTFGTDGYSVQKDGKTIEDVSTILSEWATQTEEQEEDDKTKDLEDPKYENSEVIALDKQNENNENYVKKTEEQLDSSLTQEKEDTANVEDKIEKYQEEFDQKILDLFIGNTYYESNLVDPILDYDKITITPKPVENSNASTVNSGATTNNSTNNNTGLEDLDVMGNTKSAIGLQNIQFVNNKNLIGFAGNTGNSGTSTR